MSISSGKRGIYPAPVLQAYERVREAILGEVIRSEQELNAFRAQSMRDAFQQLRDYRETLDSFRQEKRSRFSHTLNGLQTNMLEVQLLDEQLKNELRRIMEARDEPRQMADFLRNEAFELSKKMLALDRAYDEFTRGSLETADVIHELADKHLMRKGTKSGDRIETSKESKQKARPISVIAKGHTTEINAPRADKVSTPPTPEQSIQPSKVHPVSKIYKSPPKAPMSLSSTKETNISQEGISSKNTKPATKTSPSVARISPENVRRSDTTPGRRIGRTKRGLTPRHPNIPSIASDTSVSSVFKRNQVPPRSAETTWGDI